MSGIPTLIKQPSESRLYTFDFSALLGHGETVASVTSVVATTPTGAAALTLGSPTVSGTAGQVRVSGGTNGYAYKMTMLVISSSNNTLEGEGILQVKDL